MWQDTIITTIIILFSYALIPQAYQGFKEKKGLINIQTSLITSIGMYVLAFVYNTLNLTFSTIMSILAGTIWLVLLIQKLIYKN